MLQRAAVRDKADLFSKSSTLGLPQSFNSEDEPLSAADIAALDDDLDDNLTLVELARKVLRQARAGELWTAIHGDPEPEEDEDAAEEQEKKGVDQDYLLQVSVAISLAILIAVT